MRLHDLIGHIRHTPRFPPSFPGPARDGGWVVPPQYSFSFPHRIWTPNLEIGSPNASTRISQLQPRLIKHWLKHLASP